LSNIPFGRFGNKEDTVGAAVFLSFDASAFVNGQVIYVDGGQSAVG
jgi:gluconate 5-dehydrogenase